MFAKRGRLRPRPRLPRPTTTPSPGRDRNWRGCSACRRRPGGHLPRPMRLVDCQQQRRRRLGYCPHHRLRDPSYPSCSWPSPTTSTRYSTCGTRNICALFRYIQSHTDMDHMDGLGDLFAEFPPSTSGTRPTPARRMTASATATGARTGSYTNPSGTARSTAAPGGWSSTRARKERSTMP